MGFSRRRDILLAQKRLDARNEPSRDKVPAKVFSIGGSIDVDGMPGYVWVYMFGIQDAPKAVLRGTAHVVAGSWVEIAPIYKQGDTWQILGTYAGDMTYTDYAYFEPGAIPSHAQYHVWVSDTEYGYDRLPIYMAALQFLKTEVEADLTVRVSALSWGDGSYFLGDTIDLTAYVPVAGTVPVLVYLDTATNHLAAVAGTYVPPPDVFSSATAVFPNAPPTAIPSAYVMLATGQTEIVAADIYEARSPLDPVGRQYGRPFVFNDGTTLTISGDAVTATLDHHLLESEAGVTDDLSTISGGDTQQILYLLAATGHTITLRHNVGNILLGSGVDTTITESSGVLLFFQDPDWIDISSGEGHAANEIVQGNSAVAVTDAGTGTVGVTIDAATVATFAPYGMLLAGAMRLQAVVANATGAYAINHNLANVFDITLTGNTLFSMSNPPATGISGSFLLILHPASFTPTFPGSWVFTGGSAITGTGTSILSGFTVDGGTTYYVTLVGTGL